MKRIIFYVGLIITISIFLFLILPFNNLVTNIANSYYKIDGQSSVANSKEAFRNYTEYIDTIINENNMEVNQEFVFNSTGGQHVADMAYEELEWYKNTGKTGGQKYYYWYDLSSKLKSVNGDLDNSTYMPIDINNASNGFYAMSVNSGNYVAWCAIFVSCMEMKAGFAYDGNIRVDSSCSSMYRWYVAHNADCYLLESSLAIKEGHKADLLKLVNDVKEQRVKVVSEYIPAPGDLIFFDRRGSDGILGEYDHVGIVYKYDETTKEVFTIEGNTGSSFNKTSIVKMKTYAVDNENIVGYVKPNYQKGE